MNKRKQIAIIWSAGADEYPEWSIDIDRLMIEAYDIGSYLAEKWCIVVTGWKGWIMEAASRWAKDKWGITVWVVKWNKRRVANDFVDVEVVTNMWDGWDAFLIPRMCDWFIIVGGWSGTLAEIANAYIERKPMVAINNVAWRWKKLSDTYLDEREKVKIEWFTLYKDAVDVLLEKIGR